MPLLIVAVALWHSKALHGFKGKRDHKSRDMQFSFKIFKIRYSRFWKVLETTWNSTDWPAELTQKYVTETKTPFSS